MFEEGQRVKVLVDAAYSTERGQLGREGTVLHNDETSYVVTYVKMDGNNTDERNVRGETTACEVFGNGKLALVEQELAVQQIKTGDTVEVVDARGGHGKKLGEIFKVKDVEPGGGAEDFIVLEDPTRYHTGAYASRFKVVQPKPAEARSQKITIDEVQVGDEIVAFRHSYGVETRRKGVVGSIEGGKGRTKEGNILTHFYSKSAREVIADHIYLLNRPEPKKPEIESGVYWVTEEGHPASPWKVTVTNEKAEWETNEGKHVYGTYENLVAVKSGKYELGTLVTKFHTEDPTPPKELTDLEKFVREDYVGARFRSPLTGLTYKVTAKGKVKGRYLHLEDDEWDNMNYTFDSFHQRIVEGSLEVL